RLRGPRRSTLFPYTTLFRSKVARRVSSGPGSPSGVRAFFIRARPLSSRARSPAPPGRLPSIPTWREKRSVEQNLDVYWKSNKNRSEEHTSELQSRENLVCRL